MYKVICCEGRLPELCVYTWGGGVVKFGRLVVKGKLAPSPDPLP